MTSPRFRVAEPEELARVAELLRICFPDNPKSDTGVLNWQYLDNPAGAARAWVAEQDGEFVSHLAIVPMRGRVRGRRVVIGRTADAATHPDHRRLGLLGEVTQHAVADAASRGYRVVLTSPNPQSTGPLSRVGWQPSATLRLWAAVRDPGFLRSQLRLPGALARGLTKASARVLDTEQVGLIDLSPGDQDLDPLWAVSERAPDFNGVLHDRAWWAWRHARPDVDYTTVGVRDGSDLVGAAAARVREMFDHQLLHVMDLQATSVEVARRVLAGLAARHPDVDAVGVMAAPKSRVGRLAAAAGLQPVPQRLLPWRQRFGVFDPTGGDATDIAGLPWSFAWTDLDHL